MARHARPGKVPSDDAPADAGSPPAAAHPSEAVKAGGKPGAAGDYYARDIKGVNFRAHPELYRVGKGEQGVLMVEPYKGEILPHWRFRDPEVARASADQIFALYEGYKAAGDFVGMDMARKFIQMGYTRARRYANHPGGRKYRPGTREVLPYGEDPIKAAAALVFRTRWDQIKADPDYQRLVQEHRARFG